MRMIMKIYTATYVLRTEYNKRKNIYTKDSYIRMKSREASNAESAVIYTVQGTLNSCQNDPERYA